jgi:hypothetical protein
VLLNAVQACTLPRMPDIFNFIWTSRQISAVFKG